MRYEYKRRYGLQKCAQCEPSAALSARNEFMSRNMMARSRNNWRDLCLRHRDNLNVSRACVMFVAFELLVALVRVSSL